MTTPPTCELCDREAVWFIAHNSDHVGQYCSDHLIEGVQITKDIEEGPDGE